MRGPIRYDYIEPLAFGGTVPEPATFDTAKAIILPIPLESTTSYIGGTKHGPREILIASTHMELWDEEMNVDVHGRGIFTLPEMELPFDDMGEMMAEIRRVVGRDRRARQVSFRARRRALDHDPRRWRHWRRQNPGMSVLQIDAHADLRDSYMGTRHNHACAMRRVLEFARCTQVGIRSLSTEEAKAIPSLNTTVFFDVNMRNDANWIDRVVDSLGETVYITIDCDGMDPAIMPAVGTPGARRAELGGDAGAAALGDHQAPRGGLRPGGAVPDSGHGGAELPVRQADLQNPHVPIHEINQNQKA